MKQTYLVQLNSRNKIKFIDILLRENSIYRRSGLINGKVRRYPVAEYDFINKGKSNELTPEMAAEADYKRIISKKIKEGYKITPTLDPADIKLKNNNELDFYSIPTSLCCSKPIKKLDIEKINLAIKNKNCKFDIKYNGLCHYILCTPDGEIKLFTRRLDDHTAKYPDLVKQLTEDKRFPPKSIAIYESTIDPLLGLPHMENFKYMEEIHKVDSVGGKLKEDLTETFKRQKKHTVKAAIFGLLYYNGVDVTKTYNYDKMLNKFINSLPEVSKNKLYFKPETPKFKSIEAAIEFLSDSINAKYIEGFIAWMLDEKLDISFSGKPKRRACYKVKVPKEDDVIAYATTPSKIKNRIASIKIGKYDGMLSNIIEFGKISAGLKGDNLLPENWKLPCVVEIIFDQRFPTGKYQHGRFSKKHEDKIPTDIVVNEDGL